MKAHAWKACGHESVSRVRISPSPPVYCCNQQFCFINKSFSKNTDELSHLSSSFFIPSIPLQFFKVTKILSKSVKIFYVIPDLITVIPAEAGTQEHASLRAQRSNLLSKKKETLNIWQEAGDPRLWKIIISPEMAHKLDLKEHVRDVMQLVEKDLGTKLQILIPQ